MAFPHAGAYGPETFSNRSGAPLANTPVSVFNPGTTTLATLYADRTKATTAPNPTATDASGNLEFYAAPGDYDISGNGAVLTVQVPVDVADLSSFPSIFTPVVATGSHTASPWEAVICTGTTTVSLPNRPPLGTQVAVQSGVTSGLVDMTVQVAGGGYISGEVSAIIESFGDLATTFGQGAIFTYMGFALPNPSGNPPSFPSWVVSSGVGTDLGIGANFSGPVNLSGPVGVNAPLSALAGVLLSGTSTGSYPHQPALKISAGALVLSPNSVSADYTVTQDDLLIQATAALTVTFPNLTRGGQIIVLKNTSASTVTIAAGAGATLGSEVPTSLTTGKSVFLIALGTVWHTLTAAG